MNKIFYNKLCEIVGNERVYTEELLSNHTTFRIGGKADYFIAPRNTEEIKHVTALCKEEKIDFYILGNGSNLLVSDRGYRGVILSLCKDMNDIVVDGNKIKAQAGVLLSKVAAEALKHGLAGVEFAAGIPGTVGGAVVMNAGAYDGELKQVLQRATVLTPDGEVLSLSNEELELGYRTSIISKKDYIVLEVEIQLTPGDKEEIRERIDSYKERRIDKQPLEYPSAGSTFKRPKGYFAGKLIMDAGLRGYQIGGAAVSEKHCGFVINKEGATASQVIELINYVKREVEDKFGVALEPEVKMLGDF